MGKVFKFIGIAVVALIGLIVVVAVASSGGSGDDGGTTTANEPAAAGESTPDAKAAKVGQAVKDGDFTFTVLGVKAGPSVIGTADFGAKPQGKFILVTVKVKNHGAEPAFFSGDDQYLFDTTGRKASASTDAAIYLDDASSLFEEINPGNELTGTIVFDVPKDAVPAKVELHDSAFSGGVSVPVTLAKS